MIVSFDSDVHILSRFTSDQKALRKAIGKAEIGWMAGYELRCAEYIENLDTGPTK